MLGLLTILHVIVCVFLIAVILIQQGRGGGLVDMASGMESIFGTKTSAFITKTTTILATLFLCSSLVIAYLSARQSRSIMDSAESAASEAKSSINDISKSEVEEAEEPAAAGVVEDTASVPVQTE